MNYCINNRPLKSVINQQSSKFVLADLATMKDCYGMMRAALDIEELYRQRQNVMSQIKAWMIEANGM